MTDEKTDWNRVARVTALRNRLKRQHEMICGVLLTLSYRPGFDDEGSMAQHLLNLLGTVAWWESLPDPSDKMIEQVNKALDMVVIEKVTEVRP